VAAWLRERAAEHSSITLLGFSQGMAMATSLARALPGEIAAVVGLSGFVVPGEHAAFADERLRERPLPMFWGRDPQDPVIPQHLVDSTAEWMLEHADVMKVHYTGVGHGISPQELRHVREYLTHVVLGG
ncbi:alpha/beta hydrolase, partial [Kocuria oceani]